MDQSKAIFFSGKLTEQMRQLPEFPCTVVEAPMGYGKTTAVREYLNRAEANVLWMKAFDSSIPAFWSAFCHLFSRLDSGCAGRLARLGFPNDSVSRHEALKLMEEMDIPEKTALVIDDYHLLDQESVGAFIRLLLISEIRNLHIVLIAWTIEHPCIEELALKGSLLRVTKEAFALLPHDIIKYYSLCGIRLSMAEAESLYASTEGWISALYLLMLGYRDTGSYGFEDIYKLIEQTVYSHFSEKVKSFLLGLSVFESFTVSQVSHMWGGADAELLLNEITAKNAFISFDTNSNSYLFHSIFRGFLKTKLENKDREYKRGIYQKAGQWHRKSGAYAVAMQCYYLARDFENLLCTLEIDRANSFDNNQKNTLMRYFEECPTDVRKRHPVALLAYAMALMTYNETAMFEKTCAEFIELVENGSFAAEDRNRLLGEFELLYSFTQYNDIGKMSEHHRRACALLKEPSAFMDTTGNWTFGSPSVLYMFYRKSGELEAETRELKETMPYYYQLTDGHGTGAEYMMEAERLYHKGSFEDAEITAHKVLYLATREIQPVIVICAQFLLARLAIIKGDFSYVLYLMDKMRDEIEHNEYYELMHTLDMCAGFLHACLKQTDRVPEWLVAGEFDSSRLYFPARAFHNIIYGRVLINQGEYLKLLGLSEHFTALASVFPNLLGSIYTDIYAASAYERISRREDALEALTRALDTAMPDQVFMPFVENCDGIEPLLQSLYNHGKHREGIGSILALYQPYRKAVDQIITGHFGKKTPALTTRESELAHLAAEGLSNKEIGEKLFISPNTVKTILKKVFDKMDINSRSLLKQRI